MRKSRKSAIIKRVITRSVSQTSKFVPTFGSGLNNVAELSLMAREEWEQRLFDNFWGLDKDLKDRNQEIGLMASEDRRSSYSERQLRINQLYELWDEEFHGYESQRKMYERHTTSIVRTDHLKLINSPIAVEDIIKSLWNNTGGNQENDINDMIPASLRENSAASSSLHYGSAAEGGGAGGVIPPGSASLSSFDSLHMSVHLEGLQRSREILDNAKTSYRKVLKELNKVESLFPSSRGTTGGVGPGGMLTGLSQKDLIHGSDSRLQHTGGSVFSNNQGGLEEGSNQQSKSVFSAIQEASQALGIPPQVSSALSLYNDDLEGHRLYKWDQEAMIQIAFNLLDKGNKGYLLKEDLLPISHDLQIHDLLKYTVFWSIIKKREWFIFDKLFEQALEENSLATQNPQQPPRELASLIMKDREGRGGERGTMLGMPLVRGKSSSSMKSSARSGIANRDHLITPSSGRPSTYQSHGTRLHPSLLKFQQHPLESITYFQLLDCAFSLSKELHCSITYIRTQEEQEYHTSLLHNNNASIGGRHRSKPFFPSTYWDNENNGIIRNFRQMRKLQIGDCVWGLHRKSVRWLPAVIINIHYSKSHHYLALEKKRKMKIGALNGERDSHFEEPTSHHEMERRETKIESTEGEGSTSTAPLKQRASTVPIPKTNKVPEENYYYYYDLWFPLNEKELLKTKTETISKQLLTLPSQASTSRLSSPYYHPFSSVVSLDNGGDSSLLMVGGNKALLPPLNQQQQQQQQHSSSVISQVPFPSSASPFMTIEDEIEERNLYLNALPSKPFHSEKQVCSYAFDLIDSNSCGIINLLLLIQSVQSKELLQILNTSLILSLIFRTNQSLEEILLAKEEAVTALLEFENPENNPHNSEGNSGTTAAASHKLPSSSSMPSSSYNNRLFNIPCLLSVFIDTFTTETEDDILRKQLMEKKKEEFAAADQAAVDAASGGEGVRNEDSLSLPSIIGGKDHHHHPHHLSKFIIDNENPFEELKQSEEGLYRSEAQQKKQQKQQHQEEDYSQYQHRNNKKNEEGEETEEDVFYEQQRKQEEENEKAELIKIEQENIRYLKLQKKINQISNEFISKMDFLEFCDTVYDLIKYDFEFNKTSDMNMMKKLKRKRKTNTLKNLQKNKI
jgi:hypothetical protein